MKLPSLNTSSELGAGPDLGLAKKGQSIESRPMHQLERKIAPKVLGGSIKQHGAHIKALGATSSMSGAMPGMPTIAGLGQ